MGLLLALGGFFMYGAGQQLGGVYAGYWLRHILWIAVGMFGFLFFLLIDYRLLGKWSWLFYVGGLLLLAVVLFAGIEINYARRWLALGGFTIQPSEFAKPVTLLFVCWLASRRGFRINRLPDLIFLGLITSLPILLIIRQPDHGTALVFVILALAVAFSAGLSWRFILAGCLIVALALPVAYKFAMAPYQRARIRTFLTPAENVGAEGWNAHQSILAVGSGGMYGKGFREGTQHVMGYLPRTVAPTDFIFSVIAEELGFIGAGAIICAFLGLLLCCLRIAAGAPDRFGTFLCIAVATLLFVHVYVNIGMTIGASPIIGMPLPFISYGGSFMVSVMAAMGMVENVHARSKMEEIN
ncbi:MAG: FtsW/RodA/SpoVE family cell cycle protein [Lentisphaeria bacterium]